MSREKVQRFVNDFENRLDVWNKFDVFFMSFVESILERMSAANMSLAKQTETLLRDSTELKGLTQGLSDALKTSQDAMDEESVGQLEDLIKAQSENRNVKNIQALLGVIRYNVLLQRRLSAFLQIAKRFDSIRLDSLDASKIRDVLKSHGPNLQYVWQKCIPFCRTVEERELLKEFIDSKKETDKAA